jgi:hypothetical protein
MMAFGSGFGEQQWWFLFLGGREVLVLAMALMEVCCSGDGIDGGGF